MADMKKETPKKIEDQIFEDFLVLEHMWLFYNNGITKMESEDLPTCFVPKVGVKYLKCIRDGIEQSMLAIEAAYKDMESRANGKLRETDEA